MPSRSSAPSELPASILRLVASRQARRVIIDGRSGAGKTTLAQRLAEAWPTGPGPQIVSLDDFYPGWGGLREGGALALAQVLIPHTDGRAGGYRLFDWTQGTFDGDPKHVAARPPLIVEGCGSLTADSARVADVTVWLDGDPATRRLRALERDHGGFDAYWDMWAAQEDAHIRDDDPAKLADLGFWVD
ncbi:MAG: hypothetical protein QM607_09575 [Microbacterium sp.]